MTSTPVTRLVDLVEVLIGLDSETRSSYRASLRTDVVDTPEGAFAFFLASTVDGASTLAVQIEQDDRADHDVRLLASLITNPEALILDAAWGLSDADRRRILEADQPAAVRSALAAFLDSTTP